MESNIYSDTRYKKFSSLAPDLHPSQWVQHNNGRFDVPIEWSVNHGLVNSIENVTYNFKLYPKYSSNDGWEWVSTIPMKKLLEKTLV